MIPEWLKSIFNRHPVQCGSCAKRDRQVSFTDHPPSRPVLESFCGDGVAGFPYRRDCKQYQYTWIYGDAE